jgi:hypothetical protein
LDDLDRAEVEVRVEVFDAASNPGGGSTRLVIDHVAPTLTGVPDVRYLPGPDNVLVAPSAATDGTQITVQLVFSEPLDEAVAPSLAAGSAWSASTLSTPSVSQELWQPSFVVLHHRQ